MKKHQQVPCYLQNGGGQQIVNVPLGIFTRHELKNLVTELLRRGEVLGEFVAAEATPRVIALLKGLSVILSLNLKPTAVRRVASTWYAAHEKNLKRLALSDTDIEVIDLVKVAAASGLIVFLFLIAAHLDYLQANM